MNGPADTAYAEAFAAGQREAREADRVQLVTALNEHPGMTWGDIVERCGEYAWYDQPERSLRLQSWRPFLEDIPKRSTWDELTATLDLVCEAVGLPMEGSDDKVLATVKRVVEDRGDLRDAIVSALDTDAAFRGVGARRRFVCSFCDEETHAAGASSGGAPIMEMAHTADCALRLLKAAVDALEDE